MLLPLVLGKPMYSGSESARACPVFSQHRASLYHPKYVQAFTVAALAVCLLLFILFFADLAQTFVLPMLTTVAAFAFIFGSYAQNVFENAAFIFQQVWCAYALSGLVGVHPSSALLYMGCCNSSLLPALFDEES